MQRYFRAGLKLSLRGGFISKSHVGDLSLRAMSTKAEEPLIVTSSKNGVTTLRMNRPDKLNAWTMPMMKAIFKSFEEAKRDDGCKVVVLTGTGKYYCAGVDLSTMLKPMIPRKLHHLIVVNNANLFNAFIDFPKPLIIGVNGPAIGASVTSATLTDAIVASDTATFHTPFDRLGIPPEGCSSIHFERIMGAEKAQRMLGPEGWKPTAHEWKDLGIVAEVVPAGKVEEACQALGEKFIAEGRKRNLHEKGQVAEYRAANQKESEDLADAFLSAKFLKAQEDFLNSKGKKKQANFFTWLLRLRPAWSLLL